MQFQKYPNDPQRGFNVPILPIRYKHVGETNFKETMNNYMLVKVPEPDFSLAFNANALGTLGTGMLYLNMFRGIV